METESLDSGSPIDDPRAAARRAQVLVHTRYPDTGRWYPPVAGLMAGLFVAAYALPSMVGAPVLVALVVAAGVYLRRYIERRGVLPDMRTAPGPIKAAFLGFVAVYVALVLATVAAFVLVGWWAGALVAGFGFALVLWDYERRYARAAHQAEAEAGIADDAR